MLQIIYNEGGQIYKWGEECIALFPNGVGKTGQLHVKEWTLTTFFHHIQK